jgi:transglutaminase-like putative cysteine protease
VIRNAIDEAIGDEENPYWIVRKIFEYVGDQLEFELAGGWDTAPNVLKRGTGSCSEYSFVFMAMARGAGIPTRFCAGVCERGDEASMDYIFHRWTEVYLPNYGWVPVDAEAGDKKWQADKVTAIGTYSNRILITTISGGDSEILGWNYNSGFTYSYDGRTSVDVSRYADWEPVEETTDSAGH